MLIEDSSKILGYTSIAPFVNFFDLHEQYWKTIQNPYSKRETLPLTWCNRDLVDGRIKLLRLVKDKKLTQLTKESLQALPTYVLGVPLRVFFAKLMPGDSILPHIDQGYISRASHHCHLPIKAPQGVMFQ